MQRELLAGGLLVGLAWAAGRREFLNAKNKYERMSAWNNQRTKLLVDMSGRINHLRRQRDEAMALHMGDYSRRCVTCEQLFPCQTWQTLRTVEPNIDFP